jgi:hypothetical protein
MGIKSTTTLKRAEALEMYNTLLEELYGIKGPTNEELGDLLDRLHDLKCEREGRVSFDNFLVVDDHDHPDYGYKDY